MVSNVKKSIVMVTTNKHKVDAARQTIEPFGIELKFKKMETPEIRAKTCGEVAAFSARWAAKKLGVPVIKADAGLFVDSLNGFPGTVTGFVTKTIGPKGLLKLLEKERDAEIVYALAYCEPEGEPVLFVSKTRGRVAESLRGSSGMLIDFLFVPDGQDKTLGELRDIDPALRQKHWGDSGQRFAKWFLEKR